MKHVELFRIKSQKAEYIETLCNDLKKFFLFACRKWIISQLIDIDENLSNFWRWDGNSFSHPFQDLSNDI